MARRILAGDSVRIKNDAADPATRDTFFDGNPLLAPGSALADCPVRANGLQLYLAGTGCKTALHYDYEGNTNLHWCLAGKKRILYFAADQSDFLYKQASLSGSLANIACLDDAETVRAFPALAAATGSQVTLEAGEALYMPQRSFHHMEYSEPSIAATTAYYRDAASKAAELNGPESIAMQLLANPSGWLSSRTMAYQQFPPCVFMYHLLQRTYYQAYPRVMAFLARKRMHLCRRLLRMHNALWRDYILFGISRGWLFATTGKSRIFEA